MNYIAEINSFWDLAAINPLSTGQVALWFALMHINNKCNWIEWFTVPNQVLSIHTGLSRSGILKARNELRQRGFIDFKAHGTKATSYKMLLSSTGKTDAQMRMLTPQTQMQTSGTIANSTQDSAQDGVQNSVQSSAQDRAQNSTPLNKLKHKQNKSIIPLPPLDDFSDALAEKIRQWLAYKTERGEGYKPTGLKSLLTVLRKHAEQYGDAAVSTLIDECMAAGWKGIIWDKLQTAPDKPAVQKPSSFAEMAGDW